MGGRLVRDFLRGMITWSRSVFTLEYILNRRRGIDARRKFVEPVGAWYAQVGRLHQVHHLWQYPYVPTTSEVSFLR